MESDASWDLVSIWGESMYPLNKYAVAGKNAPVIHYDGSNWNLSTGAAGRDLRSVWGISSNDIIVVGAGGTIIRYNNPPTPSSLNRLLTETRRAPDTAADESASGTTMTGKIIYNIEYTFDDNSSKNGNIHRVVYDGKHVTEFTYNEMNELTGITHPDTSTETLTYDNNGNLTQTVNNTTGETTAYEWDCFDRLMKVALPAKGGGTAGETVEFEYDSDGMLIGEKSAGMERKFTQQNRFATREVIKNGQDEWETSAMHVIHGTMLASYIGATSRRFGGKQQVSHDTKTIFYHTDHLGSVRLITDSHGNIVDSSTTDAYGNPLPHADSSGNNGAKMLSEFNFVGSLGIKFIEKIKLHNMRARWFNAVSARFISSDIIKYLNRYLHADNNPLFYIDPSGNSKCYLEKRKDILVELFHLYKGERRCFEIGKYARSAMTLLFEKCDCVDFNDFVDIIGIQIVTTMPNPFSAFTDQHFQNIKEYLPAILKGNKANEWEPPTIYSESDTLELLKYSLMGSWGVKGFKKKYCDTGEPSPQARHYLAYAFLTFYMSMSILPKMAADLTALAVLEHDRIPPLKKHETDITNWGDVALGFKGIRTGLFLHNFKMINMDPFNKLQNTKNFKKFGYQAIIPELQSICTNFQEPSPWWWIYGSIYPSLTPMPI